MTMKGKHHSDETKIKMRNSALLHGGSNRGRFRNESHRWKGGKSVLNGYILIYKPDHPFAVHGYVREHRLVMEKHMGRYLYPWDDVHHINGNRQDNRIENLMLLFHNTHSFIGAMK